MRYSTQQDCFFKKKKKEKIKSKTCGLKTRFISQFKGTNHKIK